MSEASWRADPLHVHEQRYWNGSGWTGHVADSEQQSWDDVGLERLSSASGAGPASVTGSGQARGVIPRSTSAAGIMWIAAAALAVSLVVELAMNPDVGPSPFMLVILAYSVAAAVSGVGLLRESNWAYDTVSDLSGTLIASTVIYVPFITALPEALGFVVAIVVSYALALYSLSTVEITGIRHRVPVAGQPSRRIRRYPRVAGAALVVLCVSILWAVMRWTDLIGGISPLVGVVILLLVLVAGMGIGLVAGATAGAPLRAVSHVLRVGAALYIILNMIGGGLAATPSIWEQLSGLGTVVACFVVAWYSIACVKQTDLQDASVESSPPA